MARVKLEVGSGIAGLSGRVGNLVFRMSANGRTYVQQAPQSKKRPASAAQQAHRRRFGGAAAYGTQQRSSAEGRAYYQPFVEAARFGSVHRAAVADFLNPPRILAVEAEAYQGQVGGHVRVRVEKIRGVATVKVQVLDAAGLVLEEGDATLVEVDWWTYETRQTHPVAAARQLRVLAQDRPGNEAEVIVDLG